MKIVLVGYMGSGKSSIGKLLAQSLDYTFIDLDEEIEKSEGSSVTEIFKTRGELYFRKVEHQILKKILASSSNYILALGGGTPCYFENINLCNKYATTFYLQVSVKTLYERLVAKKNKRPLIAHLKDTSLKEFIAKHLFERSHFYLKALHKIITDDKTTTAIVLEIKKNHFK